MLYFLSWNLVCHFRRCFLLTLLIFNWVKFMNCGRCESTLSIRGLASMFTFLRPGHLDWPSGVVLRTSLASSEHLLGDQWVFTFGLGVILVENILAKVLNKFIFACTRSLRDWAFSFGNWQISIFRFDLGSVFQISLVSAVDFTLCRITLKCLNLT